MDSDLRITIQSSKLLRRAVVLILFAALVSITYLGRVNLIYCLLALVIFTLGLVFVWKISRFQEILKPNKFWGLLVRHDFSLHLNEFGRNEELISSQAVLVEADSRSWETLISLHLRSEHGKRICLCVLRDCVSDQDYRRLKVVVRFAQQRLSSNILASNQL